MTRGWSTLSVLKHDPELSSIPVVMVTVRDEQARGFALGASDYLVKPLDRRSLRQSLDRLHGEAAGNRVLIVDDDPDTRNILHSTLAAEGWSVCEAVNGRDALDRLRTDGADVVLLDLRMPEMDGFEVVDVLQDDDELRQIPVVVMTAMDIGNVDRSQLEQRVDTIVDKSGGYREDILRVLRTLANRLE